MTTALNERAGFLQAYPGYRSTVQLDAHAECPPGGAAPGGLGTARPPAAVAGPRGTSKRGPAGGRAVRSGTLSFMQIPDLESGLAWVNGIGMDT
jgi:hypothetical protein